MPESVVAHNDFCDVESQVWVGVRQVADFKSKHKFSTHYLTVPTKALVSLEKLATAGMSVAMFGSCLKRSWQSASHTVVTLCSERVVVYDGILKHIYSNTK